MRFCELERKEVINVTNCKCLGNVKDLEFDECDGCIKALIVPGPAKWTFHTLPPCKSTL